MPEEITISIEHTRYRCKRCGIAYRYKHQGKDCEEEHKKGNDACVHDFIDEFEYNYDNDSIHLYKRCAKCMQVQRKSFYRGDVNSFEFLEYLWAAPLGKVNKGRKRAMK